MTAGLPVLAVVVATRGGQRLASALASVEWAAERGVLDPVGDLSPAILPPGVRLGRDANAVATLGDAPWLLLLAEDEEATPLLRDALGGVVSGPPADVGVPLEVDTLGVRFARRRGPVRLGRRVGSRVALDRALELTLAGSAGPSAWIAAGLRAERGDSVAAAVDALAPTSRAHAALLAQLGRRPGAATLVAGPLVALGRVLRASSSGPAGLARWIAAVFAGYAVVLGHARWWEWERARPAPVKEIG